VSSDHGSVAASADLTLVAWQRDGEIVTELDQQNGAFPWWTGFSDWKALTVIADYLIQSVQGAAAALIAAWLAASTHDKSNLADSTAFTGAWRPWISVFSSNMAHGRSLCAIAHR
jgi:hypothetical protein